MSQYIISPSASRDLNEIADYFLTLNLETGEKLFREFNKKCQNLASFPSMGRNYAQINPKVRGILLDGYVIVPADCYHNPLYFSVLQSYAHF